ncbi:mismatch-specific DNA-glycosylase [Nitrospira sp.]|nr:mismatch-specific DNA-glycosylase [Nitrospira sp.]
MLFVGINPGLKSASVGHHYAGPSNRFWRLLADSKLVPQAVTYRDDWRLPTWGYGLTNLASRATAGSSGLSTRELRDGRRELLRKIRRYRPKIVVLLGFTVASALLGRHAYGGLFAGGAGNRRREIKMAWQRELLDGARVFVLPNPSGRNAHFTYAQILSGFRRLRRALRRQPAQPNL